MIETAGLPEGFARIQGDTIIHRDGVIGVRAVGMRFRPGAYFPCTSGEVTILKKGDDTEDPAHLEITMQGGSEYALYGVSFAEVIEWLRKPSQ